MLVEHPIWQGGCVSYLRRLLLDKELVSLGLFSIYDPSSTGTA